MNPQPNQQPAHSPVVGRYWSVAGTIVIAQSAPSAKRFAKLRGVKGALSALTARLATPEEISRFIHQYPSMVAANDKARAEREERERFTERAANSHAALVDALEHLEAAATKFTIGCNCQTAGEDAILYASLEQAREALRSATQ